MKAKWEWRALGEVCKTGSGATPLKTFKDYYDGGTIPWLLSGEVAQGEITEAKNFITEAGLRNSAAKLFPANSILIAMYGATAGQVGILRFESATNQAVCAILPHPRFAPKFLFYVFLHLKERLIATATGNAQPNISQIKIKSTVIPVPPLDEQRRIVEVLDKAFAGIVTATVNTQRNRQNARALFESYAEALIAEYSDAEKETALKLLTNRITNGYVGPIKDDYVDSGVPYLLARHVKNNSLKFDFRTYISDEFNDRNKKSKLLEGDILLVQSGHIGHSAVVPFEHQGHNCHAMIVISPKSMLNGNYLSLFFNSAGMKQKFAEIRSGSTVPHLTCKLVRELMIPLPVLSKQLEIVERCRGLKAAASALEDHYRRKLAALSELKQSLLQKAFAGELT